MELSNDAIIFGLSYLNGPGKHLNFGGNGSKMEITIRARNALNELIQHGYVITNTPSTAIPGREYYRGKISTPSLYELAKKNGIDPFDKKYLFTTFVTKQKDFELNDETFAALIDNTKGYCNVLKDHPDINYDIRLLGTSDTIDLQEIINSALDHMQYLTDVIIFLRQIGK